MKSSSVGLNHDQLWLVEWLFGEEIPPLFTWEVPPGHGNICFSVCTWSLKSFWLQLHNTLPAFSLFTIIVELPYVIPWSLCGSWHTTTLWIHSLKKLNGFSLWAVLSHMLLLLAHVVLHLRFCVTFLPFVFSSLSYRPLSAGVPGPGGLQCFFNWDRVHFLSSLHTHLLFLPVMPLLFLYN